MNHVVSLMMLYLVCGYIVIKAITVYSMYTLFGNTHLLSVYRMDLKQKTVAYTEIGTTE